MLNLERIIGVIMRYFRKPFHTISVKIRKKYKLISKEADCKPDTGWLGRIDIKRCADMCSISHKLFVHATYGDGNCKCITTDDCRPTKDTDWGLALYQTDRKGRIVVAIFYHLYGKAQIITFSLSFSLFIIIF